MIGKMWDRLFNAVTGYPKTTLGVALIITVFMGFQFPKIQIDTDPENMLSEKEFVRVFHNETKKEFALHDTVVLGIVNETDPDGVFNLDTLTKIHKITKGVKKIDGVIAYDLISLGTVDNIRQGGLGQVRFEWLMKKPPKTKAKALEIRDEAKDNPLLDDVLVSKDGKAICIYVPIEEKDMSYRISQDIRAILKDFKGDEKYYITGLPVAEDTFGVEMFKQMGMSAPLAGLIIFVLMWIFFRNVNYVISPMIVAMLSVAWTMGLLIGNGFTMHIMSSMIPIFLMPIAVVDSVHILSEFFDRYRPGDDRKETMRGVMNTLFTPMFYTSITTAVGFSSLALTPIPPLKVFGLFVGIGVIIAWILTITLVPAWTMLLKESSLKKLGGKVNTATQTKGKLLEVIWKISTRRSKLVLGVALIIVIVAVIGISRIEINDNPVKWFVKDHEIRVADRVMNEHFGGTYTAYIVFEGKKGAFKEPAVLRFIEGLQEELIESGLVGKTVGVTDLVKKVYYELMDGNKEYNKIPATRQAVAQCLFSFQNSHKPDDLWHLVTPDYKKANLWVLMKSGDNKDMEAVVAKVEEYLANNKAPLELKVQWAGLTYINSIWQDRMVFGMLKALLGSFIIVFIMMTVLFRSPLWGALSMIPLSVTIAFIYGLIGLAGKDYDMPVAILSSLTLGLSIDFAIHFLQRSRLLFKQEGNWQRAAERLFEEPARAISKNALIISIGFLPLLLSTLVPYKTVGFFMATIMAFSSVSTLFILPAIMTLSVKFIFKKGDK